MKELTFLPLVKKMAIYLPYKEFNIKKKIIVNNSWVSSILYKSIFYLSVASVRCELFNSCKLIALRNEFRYEIVDIIDVA